MKYIDIHCHLNHDDFDLDRQESINRAKEQGVAMIVVGDDMKTSLQAIKIAEENENIWAIIGQHPTTVKSEEFDIKKYSELVKHPKVVGIGECGLDYFRDDYADKALQEELFIKQINIANENKKPLMLHIRNGKSKDQNAYLDAIEILKKHSKVHGDVHFFAGNIHEAREFIKLGFRLSFTGVITFARDYDEVIKELPLNMIMTETDAPFVAPLPYRGQRNEPTYVIEVAKRIAEIKGLNFDEIISHFTDNAKTLFNIKF